MAGFLVGAGLNDYAVKSYNGGGSSFTMDNTGITNSTLLFISGVAQVAGTDFNVSGVTITTTSATPAGTANVTSVQMGGVGIVNVPADSSVTAAKIDSSVALGGPSLGTNSVIRTNAQTISEDITFAGTENGMTAGPVTIAATYTVTVTSGSTWTVV